MSLSSPTTAAVGALMPWSHAAPLQRLLRRTCAGRLTLILPNGRRIEAAGPAPGPHASLRLVRWRALRRLWQQGDLGLALSYRDGDWDSSDLLALLAFGLANQAAWGSLLSGSRLGSWLARLKHRSRANTREGSRHNIAFHYDLGNDFYRHWLGESMLYSSAMYLDAPGDTLEAAQARRVERIAELLEVPAHAEVLEIGCGWGTLAAALARGHGARVTAITLSAEQLAFARERVAAEGVADAVQLRLQDYRDVRGQFDRVVSIEMIEAVGEAYWPTYFATLRERLKPGGLAVVQAIVIADDAFESYRRAADFIQHCIFPGGMLLCPRVVHEQAARAGLVIEEEQGFGLSYARTLAEWRERFLQQWPAIAPLGFDDAFKRLWSYYLSYCEAGFRAERLDVRLYRLRRPAEAEATRAA